MNGLLLAMLLGTAFAQDDSQDDTQNTISMGFNGGGSLVAGNLNQLTVSNRAFVAWKTPTVGADLIATHFQMWMRFSDEEPFRLIGSDVAVTGLPYWYVKPRIYLSALVRYANSGLHQIDHRGTGGVGIGFAPVRKPDFMIRGSLGVYVDHTIYPGSEFRLDLGYDGESRTVPRVGLLSNGRMQTNGAPVTFRYLLWAGMDPTQPRDFRVFVDGRVGLAVKRGLKIEIAMRYQYDAGLLQEVTPYDLRTSLGVGLSWSREYADD